MDMLAVSVLGSGVSPGFTNLPPYPTPMQTCEERIAANFDCCIKIAYENDDFDGAKSCIYAQIVHRFTQWLSDTFGDGSCAIKEDVSCDEE
jgi:hypothetical protein